MPSVNTGRSAVQRLRLLLGASLAADSLAAASLSAHALSSWVTPTPYKGGTGVALTVSLLSSPWLAAQVFPSYDCYGATMSTRYKNFMVGEVVCPDWETAHCVKNSVGLPLLSSIVPAAGGGEHH